MRILHTWISVLSYHEHMSVMLLCWRVGNYLLTFTTVIAFPLGKSYDTILKNIVNRLLNNQQDTTTRGMRVMLEKITVHRTQ